jgi:hypothetical protein
VLQQLTQPGRVADVGLATRQDLDVAGVDQQQLVPALFQHVPARLPVLAGRLHYHVRDALLGKPVGKGFKPRAERPKGAQLLAAPAGAIGHANAGHDLVLADIKPGAAFVDHLHRRHLLVVLVRCPAGPTESTTLKDVLTATVRGAGKAPASVLSTGSLAPRKAELGRPHRFSSLVAATGHAGLIRDRQPSAVLTRILAGRADP